MKQCGKETKRMGEKMRNTQRTRTAIATTATNDRMPKCKNNSETSAGNNGHREEP